MVNKKKVYKIDFVLIVGTLLSLMLLVGMIGYRTPYLISPQDNLTTSSDTVLFSFENADTVLIDENKNFTSPRRLRVKDDLVINLKPGVYYWMVEGLIDSEVRKLNIQSEVDLRMKKLNGKYALTNAGNVDLDIAVYNHSEWKRNFTLPKDRKENVSGSKFIGGQNE